MHILYCIDYRAVIVRLYLGMLTYKLYVISITCNSVVIILKYRHIVLTSSDFENLLYCNEYRAHNQFDHISCGLYSFHVLIDLYSPYKTIRSYSHILLTSTVMKIMPK